MQESPGPAPEAPPPDGRFGQFTPPPAGSYGAAPAKSQSTGEALAALVCGIAVAGTGCFPLGFVALYLGARARRLARERPEEYGGDGMALAGMLIGGILGGLYLLLILAYAAVVVGVFAFSGAGP